MISLPLRVCALRCRASRPVGRRASGAAIRAMAAAAPGGGSSWHILQYKYVEDILEKRGPYRAAHLEAAAQYASQGKLVLAGALAEPVDGGLFIFKDIPKEEVEAYVKADVYVQNGLVTSWTIRPYMVVAGTAAS